LKNYESECSMCSTHNTKETTMTLWLTNTVKAGLLSMSILALSGCVGMSPIRETQTMSVGGVDIIAKSAEDEVIVFRSPGDQEQYCIAPAPDAVASYGQGVSLAIPNNSVGETSNVSADILGGRNPATLISRELLYRGCEFSLNFNLNKEEATTIFNNVLDAIVKISTSQSSTGTSSKEASTGVNSVTTSQPSTGDTKSTERNSGF